MYRSAAYQQVFTHIGERFPVLNRHQRRALARWVLGALLAGSANGPSIIAALADQGLGAVSTLDEQWEDWLAQPAHQDQPAPNGELMATTAQAAAPPSILTCCVALLRWVVNLWIGSVLVLGIDASLRRANLAMLRISVLYRGTALPVAWIMVTANQKEAWMPHITRMLTWLAPAIPATQCVMVLADRGLWSPTLWNAIRANGWHPVLRVCTNATFAPTGAQRHRVLDLLGAPGQSWIGSGVAFKHRPKRIAGTLAAIWAHGQEVPWLLLTDLPPDQIDPAWYAVRMWDEHGFRDSKSMGWQWHRGQIVRPDAAAWQYLVVAVVTLWALTVGTRLEDAEQAGITAGRLRRPPTTQAIHQRCSGTAHRVIGLMQRGRQRLQHLLARGRTWSCLWLRPEPLPKTSDTITVHIHNPSQGAELA